MYVHACITDIVQVQSLSNSSWSHGKNYMLYCKNSEGCGSGNEKLLRSFMNRQWSGHHTWHLTTQSGDPTCKSCSAWISHEKNTMHVWQTNLMFCHKPLIWGLKGPVEMANCQNHKLHQKSNSGFMVHSQYMNMTTLSLWVQHFICTFAWSGQKLKYFHNRMWQMKCMKTNNEKRSERKQITAPQNEPRGSNLFQNSDCRFCAGGGTITTVRIQ